MSDVPEPAQVYLQLRSRILNLDPRDLVFAPSKEFPHVWGVIMESGYDVGSATLVTLVDGTTSLYYSTGGGMLGSGEYPPIADAAKALVAQAEKHLPAMPSSTEFPLPEVGQVRFIFLTYAGAFTFDAPENMLSAGTHPLSPLFALARNVLTQLRLLSEQRRKKT